MKLPKLRPNSSAVLAAAFAAGVLLLSSVSAVPIFRTEKRTSSQEVGPAIQGGPQAEGSRQGGGFRRTGGGGAGNAQCARGQNAGATDTGVTAQSIDLGATVVRSGIGSSFLSGAPVAMQALVDRTNRLGGVCGRILKLKMIDDAWSAQLGNTYLRSLIDQGVFAIPVAPSSEGVNALLTNNELKGVPLVGADGMVKSQYNDPWVWPVATSTVSTMHIIAQQAYAQGARTFGIVFDKKYHFGVEGAEAFAHAVKRLTKRDIPGYKQNKRLESCVESFCGIDPGQSSYDPQVQEFNDSCKKVGPSGYGYNNPLQAPNCDVIALLLEPKTALTWFQSGGMHPQDRDGRLMGPQPLFNSDFAKSCAARCSAMAAWTSYNPPLDPYRNHAAVTEYVSVLRQRDPSVDVTNSFTEGAYLGMKVFIEAAKIVGPNLTRAALREVLNSTEFDLGLGPPIRWSSGRHLGHGQMQSYLFRYQGETFVGFKNRAGFVKDKDLGEDL